MLPVLSSTPPYYRFSTQAHQPHKAEKHWQLAEAAGDAIPIGEHLGGQKAVWCSMRPTYERSSSARRTLAVPDCFSTIQQLSRK